VSGAFILWTLPVLAYFLGSFPTGVVFSKLRFGIDVREMGSGNIGATNITRNFGWVAGAFVLVVDFLKAWVPLEVLQRYFPNEPWLVCATGAAVVLGHCSSVFLGFSGGKGVASSLGCLAAVMPFTALIAGLTYILGLTVTRISAVGSLMGVLVAVGYASLYESVEAYRWMVYFIAAIVAMRHRTNLVRLYRDIRGTSTAAPK
jgi:acyl phosphate:glycerol-3-phosphate acyltransferase